MKSVNLIGAKFRSGIRMTKRSEAERKINVSISVFEARNQGSDKNIGHGRSITTGTAGLHRDTAPCFSGG